MYYPPPLLRGGWPAGGWPAQPAYPGQRPPSPPPPRYVTQVPPETSQGGGSGQGGEADGVGELASFDAVGASREEKCPICLGELGEEPVSAGQCLHLVHTSCLSEWLGRDALRACPVCRVGVEGWGDASGAACSSSPA